MYKCYMGDRPPIVFIVFKVTFLYRSFKLKCQ